MNNILWIFLTIFILMRVYRVRNGHPIPCRIPFERKRPEHHYRLKKIPGVAER